MKKKFLAVLLACMIAASVVPAVVSAEDSAVNQIPASSLQPATVSDAQDAVTYGETAGESTSVREVSNESDLKTAIDDANKGTISTIRLTASFSVTGSNVGNNQSLLTITANDVVFDGNGQTLTVNCGNSAANFLGINGCSGVKVSNLTIVNGGQSKHAINVYKSTDVTLENVSMQNMGGLGLVVNASTVTAVGTLSLKGNGWGDCINVGWGSGISGAESCSFTSSAATLNGIGVYIGLSDITNAAGKPITVNVPGYVSIADPTSYGADKANVYMAESSVPVVVTGTGTSYYASFEKAVEAAQLGDTVNLQKDVTVYSAINLHNQIILNGNGHSITAGSSVEGNFVTVYEDGTNLNNVKLIAGAKSKNVLHIYQAKNIVLTDVTLDHSKALDGAPMIVNESDVTVNGNLELITGAYSWYGFNVDARNTTANVNFAEGSSVTYTGNSSNKPLAGLDQGTGTASVTDNTGKIVAASIGEGGNTDLYDSLDKAIDAAEAIEGGATVKVLQSGLSATVDTSKNIKFDVPAGVTEPVLKDQNGNSLDITEDGSVVVVPDAEAYTATINGQAAEYKPGTVVSLYAPVYSSNGAVFEKWVVVSGNAVIANVYSNQTTFVMPEGNVTIQAVYSDIIYQPVLPEIPSYNPGGSSSKPETSKPETSEPETEWKRDDDGNTYFYKDGEKVTGWVEEDGEWYYMNEDTGAMTEESWVKVNNVWYAFDDDGHMLTGWQEIDGKWYYLKDWGGMATGWQQVDGVWYYLKGDGAMATGWVQSNGQWYYLKGNGAMATGWVESNGKWYYLYESGEMATNATIGGYYVNSNGEWVK